MANYKYLESNLVAAVGRGASTVTEIIASAGLTVASPNHRTGIVAALNRLADKGLIRKRVDLLEPPLNEHYRAKSLANHYLPAAGEETSLADRQHADAVNLKLLQSRLLRRKPGRKTEAVGPTARKALLLDQQTVEFLKIAGDGNLSKGVRVAARTFYDKYQREP